MGNQFYYTSAANEVHGPCTTLRLMALHKEGELTNTSLVCAEGTEEWVELWTVFPANRMLMSEKAAPKSPAKSGDRAAKSGDTDAESASSTPASGDEAPERKSPHLATRTQAAIIIFLLLLGLGFPYLGIMRPIPKWEYKRVTFLNKGDDRIGSGALRYSSIQIDENLLNLMGKDGWEIIGSHLEMETAFPNLSSDNNVSGIHPNIRPQSLVILFKRPL